MLEQQFNGFYTFYYRPQSRIDIPNYKPVWAGKNNAKNNNEFIGDDSGDNISKKNKYYSELTGLYWIWKNTNHKIVASSHYRRYFTLSNEPIWNKLKRFFYFPAFQWKKRYGLIYTASVNYWKPRILTPQQANQLLKTYDAIMPQRRILKYSVAKHYNRYHNPKDLILLKNILTQNYPEYVNSFNKIMDGNRLFANNMFVLDSVRFKNLMHWLFNVLFLFEKSIDLDNYSEYQERIFGFLSERLITTWIEHHQINYKELPLIYFKKLKPGK